MDKEFVETKYKDIFVNRLGEVINLGSHYNVKRNVRLYLDKYGYHRIWIKNEFGQRKYVPLHRIILSTFCPIDSHMTVNHKNGIKTDNRLENLEWMTSGDNSRHLYSVLGYKNPVGERCSRSKLKEHQVLKIRELCDDGMSAKEIAMMFSIGTVQVHRIRRRINWGHLK